MTHWPCDYIAVPPPSFFCTAKPGVSRKILDYNWARKIRFLSKFVSVDFVMLPGVLWCLQVLLSDVIKRTVGKKKRSFSVFILLTNWIEMAYLLPKQKLSGRSEDVICSEH